MKSTSHTLGENPRRHVHVWLPDDDAPRAIIHISHGLADTDGVTVTLRDGTTIDGSHVIVTLPPTLAGRIEYQPALPSWRERSILVHQCRVVPARFGVTEQPDLTHGHSPPSSVS